MSEGHFFRQQCAGFLNTPPLWVNRQFGITQFGFPEIDLANFKGQPLSKKLRLGHQMEAVFKQLLEFSKSHEIKVHNLPVKQGNQTIGEIDFIVKGAQEPRLIHVEMTYKFYIIDPEISEPIHRLMGPNRRDMFFTKMEKVKHEQFPLLHTQAGVALLAKHHIVPTDLVHQVCFKAQLFAPYGVDLPSIRPLNPDCISGFWLRFDSFNTAEFRTYRYYIPLKSEWVVAPHDQVKWTSHFETLMDINLRMLRERAPLVWMRKSDFRFEKFFVVWW